MNQSVEQGEQLIRQLSTRQVAMIAIGGAIGTGLFLGSSLAVHAALEALEDNLALLVRE